MLKITIYTTPTCHYCHMAKEYFAEQKLDYEEKNVFSDLAAREELVKKSGGFGVPVIEIDSQIVIGFDQEKIEKILAEQKDKEKTK